MLRAHRKAPKPKCGKLPAYRAFLHRHTEAPFDLALQIVANPHFVELGRKPVRIDAGALGPDLPNRPLTVTADHALLFGDMLVNAGTPAEDGTPVRFAPLSEMPTRFAWWHVELENHEVVPVNGGVPAESFIDYVGRSGFDNYDEYLDLVGADRLIPEMPFVRISARRLLPANGLRGLPAIARRPLIAAPGKPPPDATRMAIRAAGVFHPGRHSSVATLPFL